MTRVYCRCNSGHYFHGSHCALDGWSSVASVEVARAVQELEGRHVAISLAALHEAGASLESVQQCMVIEFGTAVEQFDALAPRSILLGGQMIWREDG